MKIAAYAEEMAPYVPEEHRFDVSSREIRERALPLLAWMHQHGISELHLKNDNGLAVLEVNGVRI